MTSLHDMEDHLMKSCFSGSAATIRQHITQKNGIKLSPDFYHKLLCAAAYASENQIIEILVDYGLDLNEFDHSCQGPVHYAVYSPTQSVSTLDLMARRGALLNRSNKLWQTPLFIALLHSPLQVCRFLLESCRDPSGKDRNGCTAIHYAVKSGSIEKLNMVLEKLSKVIRCDSHGRTGLHYAACLDNLPMMAALIDFDPSLVNKLDRQDNSPLHYSSALGSLPAVRLLIDRGADIRVCNARGNSPLHAACLNNRESVADLLIGADCDVNAKNRSHCSALHYSMKMSASIVSKLVDLSDIEDPCNHNLLHLAVFHGNEAAARKIMGRGANLDGRDCEGNTALHVVVMRSNYVMARMLVEEGCRVDVHGAGGMLPFHIACCRGDREMAHMLGERMGYVGGSDSQGRSCGAVALLVDLFLFDKFNPEMGLDFNKRTLLHYAAINCNLGDIPPALSCLDVNAVDKRGRTALHYAAYCGGAKVIESLVRAGGDLSKCDGRFTPFHYAAFSNKTVLYKLVDSTTEMTLRNGICTPLHVASYYGNNLVVRHILDNYPALANIVDDYGLSPVEHAIFGKQMTTVRVLLESGASPCSRKYRTVHHLCCRLGSVLPGDFGHCLWGNVNDGAERNSLLVAYEYGNVDSVQLNSCDIHNRDRLGTTILHRTALLQMEDVTKLMMTFGVRWNVCDLNGKLCTHYGVLANCQSWLMMDPYLYEFYRSFTVEDCYGFTPIHWAVYCGHAELLKYMLSYVSPEELVRCSDTAGMVTPLHLAIIGDDLKSVKALMNHSDELSPLLRDQADWLNRNIMHYCAYYDSINCFNYFFSLTPGLMDLVDEEGHTPLAVAILQGAINIMDTVVDRLEPTYRDHKGRTYLHLACLSSHVECCELVLDCSSSSQSNAKDLHGRSPLFYAAKSGYEEAVRKLLEMGADPNLVDEDGMTPIVFAVGEMSRTVFRLAQSMTVPSDSDSSSLD